MGKYELPGIEREISENELEEIIRRTNLSFRSIQVFKIGYCEGMKNKEIAEKLDLNKQYIKKVKSRALCLIRSYLD